MPMMLTLADMPLLPPDAAASLIDFFDYVTFIDFRHI